MTAIEMIAAERQRQIEKEGYTHEHDDKHVEGQIGDAAACDAVGEEVFVPDRSACSPQYNTIWPWEGDVADTIEGKGRVRQLTIAGALIVAEIERLQRAEAKAAGRARPRTDTRTPVRNYSATSRARYARPTVTQWCRESSTSRASTPSRT